MSEGARHGVGRGPAALPTTVLMAFMWGYLWRPSAALILTLSVLLLSRLFSVISIRARTQPSWHGASEPNTKGDLLCLLSADRWIRLTGQVDDLKAITSGSWLSTPTQPVLIDSLDWISRFLVYIAVVILSGAYDVEKLLLLGTVFAGHLLLMLENARTKVLVMNGRVVSLSKGKDNVKKYARRLDMAEELVREVERTDFAVRLGMINPEQASQFSVKSEGQPDLKNEVVTM